MSKALSGVVNGAFSFHRKTKRQHNNKNVELVNLVCLKNVGEDRSGYFNPILKWLTLKANHN